MIEALEKQSAYRRLLAWQWRHNSLAIDLVRIFLGGALLVRGIGFAVDSDLFVAFAGEGVAVGTRAYVLIAHIAGGLFLAAGLFTRIAAAVQVPILVVAVFFVHLPGGFGSPNQSLELSGLVLVIAATLVVYGAGRFSLDHRIFGRRVEAAEAGQKPD